MKIAFRADGGGDSLGLGHLIRCIAIAQEFQSKNIPVTFICRNYSPALALLHDYKIECKTIPKDLSLQEDQQLTLNHASDANLIILDGYTFTTEYLAFLKSKGKYVAYFDDLLDRTLTVDAVIAPSFSDLSDFDNKTNKDTLLLVGSKYVPLRHEFRNVPPKHIPKEMYHVLLTFGGEDPHNVTAQIIKALNDFPTPLHLHILIGSAYQYRNELEAILRNCNHAYQLYSNLNNVMQLFNKVDIALTAASTTIWELAAAGVPMLLIQTADNQCRHCMLFQKNDYGKVLGWHAAINSHIVQKALAEMESQSLRAKYSFKGQNLIDGKGSSRVCEELIKDFLIHNLQFRSADPNPESKDSLNLWNWRNDPHTRKMSLNTAIITWESHKEWYQKTVVDPCKKLLIAQIDGLQLGMIRFDENDSETAEVNINMNPDYRGKGFGKYVLKEACKYGFKTFNYSGIDAIVKRENSVSIRIFEFAGFKVQKIENGIIFFKLEYNID